MVLTTNPKTGSDHPVPATPLGSLITNLSLELPPTASTKAIDTIANVTRRGTAIFIPFLPGQEPELTISATKKISARGLAPVPHVPARSFSTVAQLDEFLGRLRENAVEHLLLIAGDRPTPGNAFNSSEQVLEAGLLSKHFFHSVGFAGHPERHPNVDDVSLISALKRKEKKANDIGLMTWIVTQFCFEVAPMLNWLNRLDDNAVTSPVRFGFAGPADIATLSAFAVRCGIGNSIRVLRKRHGILRRLVAGYDPTALLQELAVALQQRHHQRAIQTHMFAFGGAAKAAAWIVDASATLESK